MKTYSHFTHNICTLSKHHMLPNTVPTKTFTNKILLTGAEGGMGNSQEVTHPLEFCAVHSGLEFCGGKAAVKHQGVIKNTRVVRCN